MPQQEAAEDHSADQRTEDKRSLVSVAELESQKKALDHALESVEKQRQDLSSRLSEEAQNDNLARLLTQTEKLAKDLKDMILEIIESQQVLKAAFSAVAQAKSQQNEKRTKPGTLLGKFTVPDWIERPSVKALLIVTKNDQRLTTIDLSKRDCFILGKQKQLVHLPLEHDSISRQHIAIIHGQPPQLPLGWFLIDLNSAHGTFINRQAQRCEPNKPYHLTFGTTFSLAKSSRLYTIQPDPRATNITAITSDIELPHTSSHTSAPLPLPNDDEHDDRPPLVRKSSPREDDDENPPSKKMRLSSAGTKTTTKTS